MNKIQNRVQGFQGSRGQEIKNHRGPGFKDSRGQVSKRKNVGVKDSRIQGGEG
jgi:hypothetical protein